MIEDKTIYEVIGYREGEKVPTPISIALFSSLKKAEVHVAWCEKPLVELGNRKPTELLGLRLEIRMRYLG